MQIIDDRGSDLSEEPPAYESSPEKEVNPYENIKKQMEEEERQKYMLLKKMQKRILEKE
jgi:hypothetical protein